MTRNAYIAATFVLLFVASPGLLGDDGSAAIAAIALVPWALASRLPGRRAFLWEWLIAGLGFCALCYWSAYVWWGIFGFLALVPGFYFALAGHVLRALKRVPLALAVPAAWVSAETLRCAIEPPFGFGWIRLGTYLHATPWLAGALRIAGVGGLSWVLAAFAGGVADLVRRKRREEGAPRLGVALGLGFGPMLLAAAAAWLTSPPETTTGPRVMLVQPAFEQRRKMAPQSAVELYRDSVQLTREGILAAAKNNEAVPDLVAWGETMFPANLAGDGLLEHFVSGARAPEWTGWQITRQDVERMVDDEDILIRQQILGGARRVLPAGTSFLAGAEVYAERDGAIRRHNAVALWDADGRRRGIGGKLHLVPGAEQLCGFERFAWIRETTHSVAGYVPDLVPFDRTVVLPLETRSGRAFRFSVTVCFDNTFDDPYTAPLRGEPVDFHLVCSNEAWYLESIEYDQMVAFSRALAIATGRSVVRATNAGITIVLGPDGSEVARLRASDGDGRDRMVAGTLRATVPVPTDGASASSTPFVVTERYWLALWLLAPLLLWISTRRGSLHARGGKLEGAAAGSGRA